MFMCWSNGIIIGIMRVLIKKNLIACQVHKNSYLSTCWPIKWLLAFPLHYASSSVFPFRFVAPFNCRCCVSVRCCTADWIGYWIVLFDLFTLKINGCIDTHKSTSWLLWFVYWLVVETVCCTHDMHLRKQY